MNKKNVSKEPKFSFSSMPQVKIKPGAKTLKHSSTKRLTYKDLIFKALWQCLIENDTDSFKEILRSHIEAVNKVELAHKSKTSRRTLYRVLSPEGNPTLKNISNIIHALYA